MPGAAEPFGLVAYQMVITPQPNNTYAQSQFDAQVGKYILLNLPGNKLAVAQIITCEVAVDGQSATFQLIACSLSTQGPRSDITEIPIPPL